MKKTAKGLLSLPRTEVQSSQIKSIGYDGISQTLIVEFNRGCPVWSYTPVTEDTYKELMNSKSKGTFFSDKIRNASGIKAICIKEKSKIK